MLTPLREQLGLTNRELVAIVGAGGKSTILLTLATELAAQEQSVVVTTTTRMAPNQMGRPNIWTEDPAVVAASVSPGVALFVAREETDDKVIGLTPAAVDRIFSETAATHVLVEADGARRMLIKAPAPHEPVIPSCSTTVIVVASIAAIGRPIADVAHRSALVGELVGAHPDEPLTVQRAATVLLHPNGGLKGIPPNARVLMVVTQVAPETIETADSLTALLSSHPRIDLAISSLASLGGAGSK
jgi:molybdenum cofactor cytidylyltransferase